MEPTIRSGDGFVAVPTALGGEIEAGDVVVYKATEIQGGGLTTHRVVGESDRGYITKGDSNPFTDQDSGEPPVKRTQIVALAWQPGGRVVTVPWIGDVVTSVRGSLETIQRQLSILFGTRSLLGVQGTAYLLFFLSVLLYAGDVVRSNTTKRRDRNPGHESGVNPRIVMAIFAGAIVLSATAVMVAPAGPQEFGIISAEFDRQGTTIIETGTTESVPFRVGNGGSIAVITHFEPATEGVDVQPQWVVVPGRSTVNTTLTLSAPSEPGFYRRFVVEHRYLLVLPQSTIRSLYEIHPWLPVVAIDLVLGVPFYLLGVVVLGSGRMRSRSRDSPSWFRRLRSKIAYRTRGSATGDDSE